MFFVYALHSSAFGKIYIGFSPDPEKRLLAHNDFRNDGWTRSFQPWTLVYTERCLTKKYALKREKQLKSSRGRNFIRAIINYNQFHFEHLSKAEDC
ncbi:MAG: GIY-YIG nuclease family protein [Bacteroidota bacterium]